MSERVTAVFRRKWALERSEIRLDGIRIERRVPVSPKRLPQQFQALRNGRLEVVFPLELERNVAVVVVAAEVEAAAAMEELVLLAVLREEVAPAAAMTAISSG